jgi:LAO/AO transport system ATPase
MRAADAWLTRFLAGEARALARGLSWLEAADPRGAALLAAARVATRERATAVRVIGLTGAPGAGKSTLADRLIEAWRARGVRVAVLAVDPSSPFSGGALLGDRVRMTRWAGDDGVFVRSMASRGSTGGLAPASLDALSLLAAFGFDVVLLETVGVGQAEVDVAAVADTTVVALAPGQGDDVQAAKAGLMEIADVFALTKADRPEAERLAREVRSALSERERARARLARRARHALRARRGVATRVGHGGGRGRPGRPPADRGRRWRRGGPAGRRRGARRAPASQRRGPRAARRPHPALRRPASAHGRAGRPRRAPGGALGCRRGRPGAVDALVVDALEAALRALRGAEGVPGGAPAPADPSPADC